MDHAQFLSEVAETAGDIMTTFWSPAGVAFELKPDRTRVTKADKHIGEFVAAMFGRVYPQGVCIREEKDYPVRSGAGLEGVFDEIDGTLPFSRGQPQSVFAGAIMVDHVVQCAVIYGPLFQSPLMFTAALGQGAYCNRNPIEVSNETSGPLRVIVATATPEPNPDERYHAAALIASLESAGFVVEEMFSSSYSCAELAQGRVHGVLFPWDTLHDMVMGHCLVTEAGGVTSDLDGKVLDFGKNEPSGYIMANHPDVHARLVAIVKDHRRVPDKERA